MQTLLRKTFLLFLSALLSFSVFTQDNNEDENEDNNEEEMQISYDFSFEKFKPFMPGSPLSEIEKEYGKGEVSGKSPLERRKYYIAHKRYKFPLWVQVRDGKTVDFFARLPSYFLHDVFHQTIINRYGKQDQYLKKENNALYVWKNKKDLNITYSGSCTITCFPIFLSIGSANQSDPSIMTWLLPKTDQ